MIAAAQNLRANVFRRISGRVAGITIGSFFLAGCIFMAVQQFSGLLSLDEIGFGDSYILYDVLHFQKSGVIYRDLSLPPYLPAQYSPLVYILYSIPGRLVHFENPFIGPRLMALTAFLLCVATAVAITHALVPWRSAWLWALLLAGSMSVMRSWVLQLRGDFPGIFFDLLAIRLLIARSKWAAPIAGLCAGFATQFKITYVAALIAGSLWLLARRRWKDLGSFVAAGLASSVGIYLIFWVREHRMLQQMMALSPGIAEIPIFLLLVYHAVSEPAVLLSALAISPIALRARSPWSLLLLFTLVSFSIAALTGLQAGANYNYFYEALFAVVPAAALGVRRLIVWAGQRVGVGVFVTLLFAVYFLPSTAKAFYQRMSAGISLAQVQSRNQAFQRLEDALRGQHIFSTVPRAALFDAAPALVEPYLLSYSQRLGKFDPAPILRRIQDSEFDVVITEPAASEWRGIPHIAPNLRRAIAASYRPYCVYGEYLLQLPTKRHNTSPLETSLAGIGCVPVACDRPSVCPNW